MLWRRLLRRLIPVGAHEGPSAGGSRGEQPDSGDLVTRGARNCSGAYHAWGLATGHAVARWPDASACDFGLTDSSPIDSACLLRPARGDAVDDLVGRVEGFFAGRPGGPLQIWSAWPLPDLTPRGYTLYEVPAMVLEPGEESLAAAPSELQIAPARGAEDLQDVDTLINDVFECGLRHGSRLVSESFAGDDGELFLGRVGGVAVATATAFVSDGLCGVYAVATALRARGRGYGAAVTAAASRFRPDLPAALQASPMGYPVYLRMGFRRYGTFQLWQGPRPSGAATVRPADAG